MSDIIRLLPDSVANQIAAGEVIQRPASVLKELVENAIDAGAASIAIYLKDAGKTQIQVIDNGSGMSETDARLAFERHATSKIRQSNDLFSLHTLGFRGEALASIAAVAEVQLRSKREEDELGTQIDVAATQVTNQTLVSCPNGSTFTVKNLFFNVPVRRKFLKSDSTELNHSITEFKRIVLANEQLSFSLTHNKTEVYNLPASNLRQRINQVFGKAINQYLVNLNTKTSIVEINGFVAKPEYAKKSFGEQYFFANGRFIKHSYLHRAVMQAYSNLLPSEFVPSYFIYLTVPTDSIDINIHPTKTEVKFEDEQAIFQILTASVKESLGKFNIVPSIDFDVDTSIQIPVLRSDTQVNNPQISVNPNYNPFSSPTHSPQDSRDRDNRMNWETVYAAFEKDRDTHDSSFEQPQVEFGNMSQHKYNRLQLKGKYILTPVKSGLMVIDQKRAHERILYEQYVATLGRHSAMSQQSLFPPTIELSRDDMSLWQHLKQDLAELGFDTKEADNSHVVIHGHPGEIGNQNPEFILRQMINEYKDNDTVDMQTDRRERLAASLAQLSAIPYNKSLNDDEMNHLIEQLFACNMPNYSPSGKPVINIISLDSIEQNF